MGTDNNDSYIGLLSFLSFAFSVMAAVLAIDMYALLRTGQFGRTWRVLIIATVMFALMQALKLAELLNFQTFRGYHLSEVVELMFVISLAYAFYLQRSLFVGAAKKHLKKPISTEISAPSRAEYEAEAELFDEDASEEERDSEWARLTGHTPDVPAVTPQRIADDNRTARPNPRQSSVHPS